ncbi:hypothetical protein [Singulisphaera sp. PoT]|uniref:hypothetical protein n=1 Tax=Singulisphaera sp. PoT TaxID=3411797 RepID=UPI003BF4BD01
MTDATLLLRQIHPSFVKLGRATSAAFRPTPKDEHKLSVYHGDMITPLESFHHYCERKLESAGVMAVSVADCTSQGLPSRHSPQEFPEHAEIDFTGINGSQCEKKGKKLREAADQRGWLHQA